MRPGFKSYVEASVGHLRINDFTGIINADDSKPKIFLSCSVIARSRLFTIATELYPVKLQGDEAEPLQQVEWPRVHE